MKHYAVHHLDCDPRPVVIPVTPVHPFIYMSRLAHDMVTSGYGGPVFIDKSPLDPSTSERFTLAEKNEGGNYRRISNPGEHMPEAIIEELDAFYRAHPEIRKTRALRSSRWTSRR